MIHVGWMLIYDVMIYLSSVRDAVDVALLGFASIVIP